MLTVVGAVVYTVALTFIYTEVVSPVYSYWGFTNNSPPTIYVLLSCLVAIVPSIWMPVALQRPSQVVYWMLYVLVLVPTAIVPMFSLRMEPGQVLTLELTLLVAFALLGLIYLLPTFRLPSIQLIYSRRYPQWLFWVIVAALGLILYAYVLSVYGFNLNLVSLSDVYDVRAEYRQSLGGSAFTAYAVQWLGNVIFPLLIARGLLTRNRLLIPLGFLGQLTLYSITGFKTILFSSALLLMLLFCFRARGRNFGPTVIWGSVGLVLASTIGGALLGQPLLTDLGVVRPILTPGLLTGFYFDFFSANETVKLGHSILSSFFTYPYTLTPQFLIGEVYFGSAQTAANANIWADAFANFSYAGVIAFTIVLGLVMWAFDLLAKDRDIRIIAMLLGVAGFALANAGVFTSLLTHGIGLMFILLYFLPKESVNRVRTVELGMRKVRGSEGTPLIPNADAIPHSELRVPNSEERPYA